MEKQANELAALKAELAEMKALLQAGTRPTPTFGTVPIIPSARLRQDNRQEFN